MPGRSRSIRPCRGPRRTASDRAGSGRRPRGPRRRAGRRAGLSGLGEVFAGPGFGRADAARGGHPAGGIAVKRAEARRRKSSLGRFRRRARCRPCPGSRGRERAAPTPRPGWTAAGRDVLVDTERPTPGTGWDLEVVAFHEAVPGHPIYSFPASAATSLRLPAAPAQPERVLEGMGPCIRAAGRGKRAVQRRPRPARFVSSSLMRAIRLVVDTGLHAFGWSRVRAPRVRSGARPDVTGCLAAEIDRYVVMPGQALSYLTGKLRSSDPGGGRKAPGPGVLVPASRVLLDHGSAPDADTGAEASPAGWIVRPGRRRDAAGSPDLAWRRRSSGIAARICCSVRGSVRTRTPRASYRALPMAAAVGPSRFLPRPATDSLGRVRAPRPPQVPRRTAESDSYPRCRWSR